MPIKGTLKDLLIIKLVLVDSADEVEVAVAVVLEVGKHKNLRNYDTFVHFN